MPDYVLILDVERELWVVHDPNCPVVTKARADGAPLATTFGSKPVEGDEDGLVRHVCLLLQGS